jgi:protein SCO1
LEPFSWKAGLLFLSSGAALIFYFRYEKARMERKRVAEAAKGVGRPKVGGPFTLLDQNGKVFTNGEMKGRYSLVCDVSPGLDFGKERRWEKNFFFRGTELC